MSDIIRELLPSEPEEVWYSSPVKPDAMARIFDAPRINLMLDRPEIQSAYLTLAQLLVLTLGMSAQEPAAQLKKRQAAAFAYLDFLKAIRPVLMAPNGPPPPPPDWLRAMGAWSRAQIAEQRSPGAPKGERDHFFIPKALALYQLVFAQPPAATAGGPTERFLTAIYSEMRATLSASTFSSVEFRERAIRAWAKPTPSAMQMKIRSFTKVSQDHSPLVQLMIAHFMEALGAPLVRH